MNKNIPQTIRDLNQVFSDVILNKCDDKKVLLTLSGGVDTRAILSILLKNKIEFDAVTYDTSVLDMKVAKQIANDFRIYQIFVPVNNKERRKEIFKKYDIVLYGTLLEWFDKYEHFDISEDALEKRLNDYANFMRAAPKRGYVNVFYPAIETTVLDMLKYIPIFYRLFSYPQECIIELNEPRLMKYPRTSYNLKVRTASYCHRVVVWLMGVAGYE